MNEATATVPRTPKEINLTPKQERNFWKKVDKSGGPDACWPWMACKLKKGYGKLGLNQKSYLAHRTAWTLANSQIPDDGSFHGICVCHRCDNPACCNPAHLFLGTNVENITDRVGKGRSMKGSSHRNSKLTDSQVIKIRATYAAGGISQSELGVRFGVNQTVIGCIIRREAWVHI